MSRSRNTAWGISMAMVAAITALGGCTGEGTARGDTPPEARSHASAPPPGESGLKPQRIVSLNLCTDQLLMQMVAPERIAAITYLAGDENASAMARAARQFPMIAGTAEEVIALKPDLVLAGAFSTRATVGILRRLGYRVVEFGPEQDFPSIIANIRQLAAAVGEPARGAQMVRQIEAALAAIPATSQSGQRPLYANFEPNGFTSGDGALITAIANAAGFDTLGQRLGRPGTQRIPLEHMLVMRPDLIGIGQLDEAPALATESFRHPALQRLIDERASVHIPAKYTGCGSLRTLQALRLMVDARARLS